MGAQKAQMLPVHAHTRAHARKCPCEQPGADSNSETTENNYALATVYTWMLAMLTSKGANL